MWNSWTLETVEAFKWITVDKKNQHEDNGIVGIIKKHISEEEENIQNPLIVEKLDISSEIVNYLKTLEEDVNDMRPAKQFP